MCRLLLVSLIITSTAFGGLAQAEGLTFPVDVQLPRKFQQAIVEQSKEYDRLFYGDSATTKHFSVSFILDRIDNDSNYQYIFLAEYWIAFHYKEIIPELIKRVTDKKEVGLANSADLIIWERYRQNKWSFMDMEAFQGMTFLQWQGEPIDY